MKIPAGVDHGTRVQLTEQGEVGPGGGPAGDIYVEIHVEPHPTFTRQGNDLHSTITLPMTAAALGTTLTLPLLEADLEASEDSEVQTDYSLVIAAGTQWEEPADDSRIRRAGIARWAWRSGGHRGGRRPTRLDPRQEELLRELAAIRDEEKPTGQVSAQKSVFGRLRDAFNV